MKRSYIRRKPGHVDPVSKDLVALLHQRDRGCVGVKVGMPGECGSQFGVAKVFNLEVDHVNTAGLGKRGPSTPENTVLLCGLHHRVKTEASKRWRAEINAYLGKIYGE